jgi:hypothetical protein
MIQRKIKIYKSLVYDIEGGLGVKESDRTYASRNPVHVARSKTKLAEEKKALETKKSQKNVENTVAVPQKKGILKNARPAP